MNNLNIFEFVLTSCVRAKCNLFFIYHKLTRILVGQVVHNHIILMPHEGLGDLIAIIPALKVLKDRGVDITMVADKYKWIQIENAFADVPFINIIHYISNGSYYPSEFISSLKGPSFVALGNYSSFPIVDYPSSFFWQMGVNKNVVSDYLFPKPARYNFNLPKSYVFIDLNTSKGLVSTRYSSNNLNSVFCVSNNEVLVNDFGVERRLFLDVNFSFHQKISMALNAEKVICSDAGLFNALIRFKKRPQIQVHSRKHRHTHFFEIYRHCRFDGGIYIFSATEQTH